MNKRVPYLYSVLRLVPNIERGESLNIGLVMFCRPQRFLKVAFEIHPDRIAQFASYVDSEIIAGRLETYAEIASGDSKGGPVAALDMGERFHWLTNISNTMIQPDAVHPGLTASAEQTFARLFGRLVAPVTPEP